MTVQPITYQECKIWFKEKHYAKRIPSVSFAFGLFVEDTLWGVVSFGKPSSNSLCEGICGKEFKGLVFELNRLVINSNAPTNSASFLVGRALRLLPKNTVVVSYADRGQNHNGYIYQATNFIYTGATKRRTDIAPQKGNDGAHSRHYDKSTVDYSLRVERSSKHRYVYFTNKKMVHLLKYPILPYPKEKSEKYDCLDIYTHCDFDPYLHNLLQQYF